MKNGLTGHPPNFGPEWTLREARRLAFEAGVCDSSRITALQELLGRPDDPVAPWEEGSPQWAQAAMNEAAVYTNTTLSPLQPPMGAGRGPR